MDLKDAHNMIDISIEEKESIERYLGFKHTNINILGDFDPETYEKLSKRWRMPQKSEEIISDIKDFVNIYAAMYKESKNTSQVRGLVRGTSNKRVHEMKNGVNQFLSTSTDEDIAKTFTEYGDGALVYFNVDRQVPFLDTSMYKSEDTRDEHEIILSPFCKTAITSEQKASDEYGYSYYQVSVQKADLVEKSKEELEDLQEEVVGGLSQNIEDMKEFFYVRDKLEYLYERASHMQGDPDLKYLLEERSHMQKKYNKLYDKTHDFRDKLQTLLKGMCRQKEIEIDKAHELINEEAQRKKAEREAKAAEERKLAFERIAEEKRIFAVTGISSKIAMNPQNALSLQDKISATYEGFVRSENTLNSIAQKFGISIEGGTSNLSIQKLVTDIGKNIQDIDERVKGTKVDLNTTLEDAQEASRVLTPLLDGISYGNEIANDFPEINKLYKQQLNDKLKKELHGKVEQAINQAKVQKYLQERDAVQNEPIGFFGKLTGKEKLRAEKLRNLDLKIELARSSTDKEQEHYSVREMLADMHVCATMELGGQFTPEMRQVYDLMKSTFKDTKQGEFTEDYIRGIANRKMLDMQDQKSGLPAVQTKVPRFFGKTKAQTDLLENENVGLERKILLGRTARSTWVNHQKVEENDAVTLFEQRLAGIANNTRTKESEKGEIDKDTTLDLWGQN